MQMRPDIQIQSMIKALTDVVLPAIDPANKLAHEQSRLIIGTLTLMARQLPLQFRFDCDELARLLEFSAVLQRQVGADAETTGSASELADRVRVATAVQERARAEPEEVLQAIRGLREASGTVITAVFRNSDAATQDRVQQSVLAMSSAQLLRDRSWLLFQGWEPDPKAVPPIETLISPKR